MNFNNINGKLKGCRMKNIFIWVPMFYVVSVYGQTSQIKNTAPPQDSKIIPSSRTSSISEEKLLKQMEFGITGMVMNLSFPAFDVTVALPFFKKDIHALLFKTSLFTFVNANYQYKPTFVLFGLLPEIQYRLTTYKGFVFALETGLGIVGEFALDDVFSIDKGFHRDPGIPYGMFSTAIRLGYDFYSKYKMPFVFDFMLGYRMLFPYNLKVSNNLLFGLGLSYMFDFK